MAIKIYSTPSCVYCKFAKQLFDKHNVAYEEIDVAENDLAREDMIRKSQQMGVPVIDIDGEIIVGFQKDRLVELLHIDEKKEGN